MSLTIPAQPSLPQQEFEIEIEGGIYRFAFRWNPRREFWNMSIKTVDGIVISQGMKLMINYEMIRRYSKPGLPPGAIIPIDPTNRTRRIGLADLGADVKLVYLTKEEYDGIVQQGN
jgi:hypothetical protein